MGGGLHPPLSVLGTWVPNYVNPVTRDWTFPALIIVLYILAFACVALRVFARVVYMRNAGIDDMFMVLALLMLTGYSLTLIGAFRFWGFSKHAWDLHPLEAVTTRKVVFAIDTQYTFATVFIKVSILLFYRRVSCEIVTPIFRWVLRGTIAFVVATHVAIMVTVLLSCRPLNAFWWQVDFDWEYTHVEGVDYVCAKEPLIYICSISFVVLQDFMTVALPMTIFWRLRLPFRQKAVLSVLFGIGIVSCLCAVLRIYYVHVVFYESYDVTWFAGPAYMTSAFESSLGIICGCVPSLKFYFRKFFDSSQPAASDPLPSSFTSFWSRSTAEKSSQKRKGSSNTIVAPLNEYRPDGGYSETKVRNARTDGSYGHRDWELGTISVTRELDIESVYNESYATEPKIFWARETSSPRAMSFADRPLREYLADNAQVPESWLDEDSSPPTPTRMD